MSAARRRRSRELEAPASPEVEALADRIVEDVFTNGAGQHGVRLVITNADGADYGGWSRAGFRDRLVAILAGQVKP